MILTEVLGPGQKEKMIKRSKLNYFFLESFKEIKFDIVIRR